MPSAAAVLLAAGSGRRLAAGRPKALVPVGGRPLVAWSCALFAALPQFEELVLVVPDGAAGDEVAEAARAAGSGARLAVVPGGSAIVSREPLSAHAFRAELASLVPADADPVLYPVEGLA